MKAERRHELKTNTLAQRLENLPDFWRVYGTKISLGVIAVLAIILLVRFQRSTARQQQEEIRAAYAEALGGIGSLGKLPFMGSDLKGMAEQRRAIREQADSVLQQTIEESDDETLRAEATIARGDLYWYLARSPGAASAGTAQTQPSEKTSETTDDLLEVAKKSFESATSMSGATPAAITRARFGIAAIAEQRKQWNAARKMYETINNDPTTPDAFRGEVQLHLSDLERIQRPVLLGKPATEPSDPTPITGPAGPPAPATTRAATTTSSTTTPAAPTTRPSQTDPSVEK